MMSSALSDRESPRYLERRSMKITALAPANIAVIKYWGRKDDKLRLPANSSISINLSGISTVTTVQFLDGLHEDAISIDGRPVVGVERSRVTAQLDRVRNMAGIHLSAMVESTNNFPKGTGLASSASGFAALSLAASCSAGLS